MRRSKIIIALMFLGAILMAYGCSTVQPWQREPLASPIMIFDNNPIQKGIELHHIEYRQGSAGATGSQSGGCGCG